MDISGKPVRIQIWDTAGQEKYRTINAGYYKNVHGVCLMYSVIDKRSFESRVKEFKRIDVTFWLKSLDENSKEGICKVLVGNKADLSESRKVSYAEGKALAAKNGLLFYETSAKTGVLVEEVFMGLAHDILKQNPNIVSESENKKLKAKAESKQKEGCC